MPKSSLDRFRFTACAARRRRRLSRVTWLLAAVFALTMPVQVLAEAPIMTSKSIPEATVSVIDPESGTSSGGGTTDVNVGVGDIILFRMSYTAVPNSSLRGIQAYVTDYIPANTEVVGIRILDENELTIPPNLPGLAPDDCGATCNGFTGLPWSGGTRNLTGGSISQVYADTGLFYTQSTLMLRRPADDFISLLNGDLMDPEPRAVGRIAVKIGAKDNPGDPVYAHNIWDHLNVRAFGTQTSASGNQGTGNGPHGFASPVAGLDTHYQYTPIYDPTPTTTACTEHADCADAEVCISGFCQDIWFDDQVGPWSRIYYPGSVTGTGVAATGSGGDPTRTVVDSAAGVDLSPNNALPSGTTAIRLAMGELRVGDVVTVEVALRVLATPLDPQHNFPTGADVNCAEIHGGELATPSKNTVKDNPWTAYIGSPACVFLNLLFDLEVDKLIAANGETLTYKITGKNLSINTQTGAKAYMMWVGTDIAWPPVSTSAGATLEDPCSLDAAFSCVVWDLGDLAPSQEYELTAAVTVSGIGDGVVPAFARYTSTQLPSPGFQTKAVSVVTPVSVTRLDLTNVSPVVTVPPATTADFTGTICNEGTATATYDDLRLYLPTGWSVASLTVSGVASTCTDQGNDEWSCPPAAAVDDVTAGNCRTLNFTLNVPNGTADGLYPIDVALRGAYSIKFESYFRAAAVQPVGEARALIPTVHCPIDRLDTTITGTSGEPDGTIITIYFNGIPRGTATVSGGVWTLNESTWDDSTPATFGPLYPGLEVRASANGSTTAESERSAACFVSARPACSDGVDNDGDGLIDFPADPGCSSPTGGSEVDPAPPACSDGVDNDGDSLIDYPADPSCSGPDDDDESGNPACSDGIDNDNDGFVDFAGGDPGCTDANDVNEIDYYACNDGIDNDGDGKIDFPDDPGCHSINDTDETDFVFPSQPIKPRLLIVFDTSGSMNWNSCNNTFTGGDGTTECDLSDVACATCGSAGCGDTFANDSRIYKVKAGLTNAVTGYGSVDWGLMRFFQKQVPFTCPTANAGLRSGAWQGGGAAPCSGGFDAGELLVGFSPDNANDLLMWMDGSSNYPSPGPPPKGMDIELRGTGTTPLAGSLNSAGVYVESVRATDPQAACRPYRVILVTDGLESCGGDPVAAATTLDGSNIPVHVIGFATSDATITTALNDIAVAGGTTAAVFADDDVSLSTAIGDIISSSILVERCNNVDDDCDTLVDEDFPNKGQPCNNGELGACNEPGVFVCRADELGVECNAPAGTSTPEVCDGIDNDCDGLIDEDGVCACNQPDVCDGVDNDCNSATPDGSGDPRVGQPCGTDVGACVAGTTECIAGNVVCNGTGPAAEVCDVDVEANDQNCNGVNNDGIAPRACSITVAGVGTCTGLEICNSDGNWVNCSAQTPTDEVCNNRDDNCDGQVDENVSQTCQVTNAFGTCLGTEICTAGTFSGCTAATPAAETCNNLDDDCDGSIDENISQACYTGPAGTQGVGICRAGTETCNAGSFGACQGQILPQVEVCDGIDNDCDGQIDEDATGMALTQPCYTGPAGTAGVGICTAGTRTCSNGSWGACVGEVTPQTEVCDAFDNDCDGQLNENLGQTTCGLGVCQHTVDNCVAGVPQVCDPLQGAGPEVCDGLDNDCDGAVDGITRPCYTFAGGCTETSPGIYSCNGACAPGIEVCPLGGSGSFGACQFQVGPEPELCDGLDNDCDGAIDEDSAGGQLAEECYSPGSGANTGCTFDASSLSWSCLGECNTGTRDCSGAAWGTCVGENTPGIEVCDGLDNDCDGETDEASDIPGLNQPCGTALGRCSPGTLRCNNGVETCEGGVGPFPGECNALDDDCDGEIDEPDEVSAFEGQPCGDPTGACVPGQTECIGGQLLCVGEVRAASEVCDGIDNDCDGVPDNGAECPPSFQCVLADCRPECDPSEEFPCPGSLTCQTVDIGGGQNASVCLPSGGICGGTICPDGLTCVNDQCVDLCDPNPCETWEQCVRGGCVDVSCTAPGNRCPAGEVCYHHECVADPCANGNCDAQGEFCSFTCDSTDANNCQTECEALCECDPDQVCNADGSCSPANPCADAGTPCRLGERCNRTTETCEPDPCAARFCGGGEVCFEGACVDDPCAWTMCPEFFLCQLRNGTDAFGNPTPDPYCKADPAYYAPGAAGGRILATGGGGCGCTSTGGGEGPAAVLFLLLILWLRRRRPESAEEVR